MPHFLTVQFHGKRPNEYGAPAPFFKVDDPAAGRQLLTLFREDFGAEPPKEPRLVFDLVAADGLAPAQAVRFKASVRQVHETWDEAYCVTDAPRFPAGWSGDLARLYDRAYKWQVEIPGQKGNLIDPSKNGAAAEPRTRASERMVSVLYGVLGIVLTAIVISALEAYIHLASGQISQWILGHNHSLGLQLSCGLIICLGFMGLFLRKYRKWIWGTGVLAIVSGIVQII